MQSAYPSIEVWDRARRVWSSSAAQTGEGSRLLIVEDADDICEVVKTYLTDRGYVVTTANRGTAARRALERESFDGVIIDVVLPGVSGLDLAEIASARDIPVLLISGKPSSIEQLDRNSRHQFLKKPFHLDELGSALHALLNSSTVLANVPRTRAD